MKQRALAWFACGLLTGGVVLPSVAGAGPQETLSKRVQRLEAKTGQWSNDGLTFRCGGEIVIETHRIYCDLGG